MTEKKDAYKVTLAGGKVGFKDQPVSDAVARKITMLIMGADVAVDIPAMGESGTLNETITGIPKSPKAFMAKKRPTSEIERITCLAYFLYHNREVHAFKTRDITKLNTEAAQPSFTNASVFARNAVKAEYLSLAGGGNKQITALGEDVIKALPDRDKVKEAIQKYRSSRKKRPRKRRKKATPKTN